MNIFEVSINYVVKVQAKDENEAQELSRGLAIVKYGLTNPVIVIKSSN